MSDTTHAPGDTNKYYVPHGSPWPILGSVALFTLMLGASSFLNDWAGAWAVDNQRRPQHASVPDGERQREMAFRFGVNLVMYALTGNYKSDQVHVPAILERLGH